MMSDSQQTDERDPSTGRFLSGNNGGGRQRGSRNKLAETFISDLYCEWQKSGAGALARVAHDDPAAFVRVIAGVLPKELDATLTVEHVELFTDAKTFAEAYRLAQRYLGADVEDEPIELIEELNAAPNT